MDEQANLTFRGLQSESDHALLLDINLASRGADNLPGKVTLLDIANALAHMDGFTPQQGILIASSLDAPGTPIGYSRLGWYSSSANTRLYYQVSFLKAEYRGRGLWETMVKMNEQRLGEAARQHASIPQRYFQAWATDRQQDWMLVLENTGYRIVRRFNNMVRDLREVRIDPLPADFEIRPTRPEHMHAIWEAQKEMNAGLFENVVEDWQEDKFPAWLAVPAHEQRFWQVAWAGEQIAGITLARIDEKENEGKERKRGYTEHVFVRSQWRKRGLASALITRSLQVLKDHGMDEAELGVDSENESAAFNLYQKIGFKTENIDTWFRKKFE